MATAQLEEQLELDLFEEVQGVLDLYFPDGYVPSRTRAAIDAGICRLIDPSEHANTIATSCSFSSSPLPS